MKPRRHLRPRSLFAALSLAAVVGSGACSRNDEGGRCDRDNGGNNDCESGLECVSSENLRRSDVDRCCPAEGSSISDDRCERGSGGGAGGTGGTAADAGDASDTGGAAGQAGGAAGQAGDAGLDAGQSDAASDASVEGAAGQSGAPGTAGASGAPPDAGAG